MMVIILSVSSLSLSDLVRVSHSKTYSFLTIEVTMCNPPFYSTLVEVEAAKASHNKEDLPYAVCYIAYMPTFSSFENYDQVCTGAPVEMVTSGGEANFVAQMVRESVLGR
jgi:23S rRNA A1618 N6-methylase RlmF